MIRMVTNGENLDEAESRGCDRMSVESLSEVKTPDFKLIPLFKPLNATALMANKCNPLQYEIEIKKILNCWQHITEGLEVVGAYTKEDMSLTETLNEILSGNLLLWMGFIDGKYSGFVTTRIDRNPDSTTWLSMIQCYTKPGSDKGLLFYSIEQLKEFAITHKCQKMRLWSKRRGWGRKLESVGFKESYIQFDLDLIEGK